MLKTNENERTYLKYNVKYLMNLSQGKQKHEVAVVTDGRLKTLCKSLLGCIDFIICIYLVSLFFQGTMPGKQQLREAFRQLYSFFIDPENLIITSLVGLRLTIYGISRWSRASKAD
ncbi:MAG: hypothetical protein CMJ76_11190 [Planctomycetaceae bacterium]|nr:hypothetical protein [Planctomycetaceae bacterium]